MTPYYRFRKKITRDVQKYGRSVISVFPDESSKDPVNETFVYTIGNSDRDLPELLMVGMTNGGILNHLSEMMIKRGAAFANGEMVSLGGEHPVCMINASAVVKDIYTIHTTAWRDADDYNVMQAVAPDPEGRFPWQPDCAEPYARVRVFRLQ
jgi:hypothetical protein